MATSNGFGSLMAQVRRRAPALRRRRSKRWASSVWLSSLLARFPSSTSAPSTQSPAVRSAPASPRRAHSRLLCVGTAWTRPRRQRGLALVEEPGLGIPCRRRRRRGRRGPRRGRRFQVQVPARPRVSAEITACQVGQSSALLTRRAQLHDSLGDLRVHGVLGYGSEHASWLWSAPSPTFEQMMDGPSSAPEAIRRVRRGGWRRREAVGGLAPASSGSWLVL